MLLQLHGIGNQKIEYKDHKDIEFETLDTYLLLAKKSISKFANQFYQGLSAKMLKDEDAVASVANAIMMADWRWDENYSSKEGTKKTKYSYRNQCAIWAIQTYITKGYKKPKHVKNVYSLDFTDVKEESDSYSYIDNNQKTPDDILEEQEDKLQLKNLIDNLLSLDCLTDRQKDYIRLYYFESQTFEKIGKKYGITREAVRQGLSKAISIIKNAIND